MAADRRIVLFDLFGVIALDQRPGALAQMADLCHAPADAFARAYWDRRQPYDAGQQTAPEYWTGVLHQLGLHAQAPTLEALRLADIDSWSRVDDRMVSYLRSLHGRAETALLSNIPADHADAFEASQPWLDAFDHLALSGRIHAAKPDPAAFRHVTTAMAADPADFLFTDDRPDNIHTAQTLGMATHLFTTPANLATAVDTWLRASEGQLP